MWEKNFSVCGQQSKGTGYSGCTVVVHGGFQDPAIQNVPSNLDCCELEVGLETDHPTSIILQLCTSHQAYTTADLSDCLCLRVCFPV